MLNAWGQERCLQGYGGVVRKREGNSLLRRSRRRWEDDIEMDLKESGWDGVDWIYLAEGRDIWRDVMSTVLNLRVSINAGNFLIDWGPFVFLSRPLLILTQLTLVNVSRLTMITWWQTHFGDILMVLFNDARTDVVFDGWLICLIRQNVSVWLTDLPN